MSIVQVVMGDKETVAMNTIRFYYMRRGLNCTMSGALKKAVIFYAEVADLGLETEMVALVAEARERRRVAQGGFRAADLVELPEHPDVITSPLDD